MPDLSIDQRIFRIDQRIFRIHLNQIEIMRALLAIMARLEYGESDGSLEDSMTRLDEVVDADG